MAELASSVSDEIAELREVFPNIKIQTSTKSFLIASYQRTPYTCITFTLTFPEGYPDHPLIIDIKQNEVVPPGLKKKLEQDLVADIPLGIHQQVITAMTRLVQFVDNNKFLPCWKELKQTTNLVTNDGNGSTISIIESKAKITLKLCRNEYFYSCSIKIDNGYPSTTTHENWGKACVLKLISTNFPPKIETMLTSQAVEVIRRMQDGITAEQALVLSNPIKQPKFDDNDSKSHQVKDRLTNEMLKGLKHDVDILSNVRELREKDASRVQGKAHVLQQHTREKKAARRAIHKITDQERAADLELAEQEKQWREEETNRLSGYNLGSDTPPQPSLLALTTFLKEKIQLVPDAKCPCCESLALLTNPNKLKLLYSTSSECKTEKQKKERKEARAMRPVRTYCGCWYHYKCLNTFMTEPPFGLSCPTSGCGRRVFHPDWPDDISQLERDWAGHQARLREVNDAAMFL